MNETLHLIAIILPVFLLIGIGLLSRRVNLLSQEADTSMLKLVVTLLYPSLVLNSVLGNPSLRDPGNLLWPPILGFLSAIIGFAVAYYTGKLFKLKIGYGLRTFAYSIGIYNYGYMGIPLVAALFPDALGVLFVFNLGIDLALWTVGMMILAGGTLREGMKKVVNPTSVALVSALVLNHFHADTWIPRSILNTLSMLADCAIPVALLLIGAMLNEHLSKPGTLFNIRIFSLSALLRLGLLPCVFLLGLLLPVSMEIKQVIVVQASLPSAVLTIALAKHYGGHPLTAVQVIFATLLLSLFTTPLWIRLGINLLRF